MEGDKTHYTSVELNKKTDLSADIGLRDLSPQVRFDQQLLRDSLNDETYQSTGASRLE